MGQGRRGARCSFKEGGQGRLIVKVAFKQRLEEGGELAMWESGGRVFQA